MGIAKLAGRSRPIITVRFPHGRKVCVRDDRGDRRDTNPVRQWRFRMRHLRNIVALFACFAVMAIGANVAVAGGSSDTSGDGFHCYLFFSLPGQEFAQAMVNNSDRDEVVKKAEEFIEKYALEYGGQVDQILGNVRGSVCAPRLTDLCAVDCVVDRINFENECTAKCLQSGGNTETCILKCEGRADKIFDRCLDGCDLGLCETSKDCQPGQRCCPNGDCISKLLKCPKA